MYVGTAHHAHHNLVDGPRPTAPLLGSISAPLLGSIAQNAAEKAEFGGGRAWRHRPPPAALMLPPLAGVTHVRRLARRLLVIRSSSD
jgi:hypothetical protein